MDTRDIQGSILMPLFSSFFSDPPPVMTHPDPTGVTTDSSTNSPSPASDPVDFPALARLMYASRRKVHDSFRDAVTGMSSSTSRGRIRQFLTACRALPDLLRTHTSVSAQDCAELHQQNPDVYPAMAPAVLSRILSTRSHAWLSEAEVREIVGTTWLTTAATEQLHGYLSKFADGPSVDIILVSAGEEEESFRLPFLTLAWEIAEAIVEPHKRELRLADEIRSSAAALDESARAVAETVAERVGDALCRHAGLIDVCDRFFRPIGMAGKWRIVAENKFDYEVEVPEFSEAMVKLVESLALALFDFDPLCANGRRKMDANDMAALEQRFPFCPISFVNGEYSMRLCHLLPTRGSYPAFDHLVLGLQRHAPRHYRPLPGTLAPWYDFNSQHGVNGEWSIVRVGMALNSSEDWVFVLKWPPMHCPPDAFPHSILRFFTLDDKVVWDGMSDPRTAHVHVHVAGANRTASSSTPSLTFWNLSGRVPTISPLVVRDMNSAAPLAIACVTGMTGMDATFTDNSQPGHRATTPYPVHDPDFPPPFIWDFVQAQRFVAMYGTSALSAVEAVAEELLADDILDVLGIGLGPASDDDPGQDHGARSGASGQSPSTCVLSPDAAPPNDTGPEGLAAPGDGLSAHTYACLYVLLRLMLAGRPTFDDGDESDHKSGFTADMWAAREDAQPHGLDRDAIADWQGQVFREQEPESAESVADMSS